MRLFGSSVERRRRDKINNWFVTLSKIIPDCNMDSSKTGAVSEKVRIAFDRKGQAKWRESAITGRVCVCVCTSVYVCMCGCMSLNFTGVCCRLIVVYMRGQKVSGSHLSDEPSALALCTAPAIALNQGHGQMNPPRWLCVRLRPSH